MPDRSGEESGSPGREGTDGLTYRAAGVDLNASDRAKERLRTLVQGTQNEDTLSKPGSFGGLHALPSGIEDPVLASSADGVGTKLKIAFLTGRHDTVGQDLVNHCVNDILVQGARPLFFLDYLATGEMDEGVVSSVVEGVARGCRENRCALLGGETAQMPDFYSAGEYDLAGFVVGIVERGRILDGSSVRDGDLLVGIASSGLHTNGYSLARKILFDRMKLRVHDPLADFGRPVGSVLLDVHKSYLAGLGPVLASHEIHGLAHITGGGIPGNLSRSLGDGLGAVVWTDSWRPPPIFRLLQRGGGVDTPEMRRVFNMGVGMIAITPPEEGDAVVESLLAGGEEAWILGRVDKGEGVRFV